MKPSEKPAPIPVFFQGEKVPCGYACGICKHIWNGDAETTFAHRCCPPNRCEREGCDEARGNYIYCEKHLVEVHRMRFVNRVHKAKHVQAADWTQPVWNEPADDHGWRRTVGDLVEEYDGSGTEGPSWVWGCEERSLSLDANDILTSATENAECGEVAEEEAYAGEQDLQVALDAWCKSHPVTWWELTNVVVVIDPKRFAEEFGQPSEPKEGA